MTTFSRKDGPIDRLVLVEIKTLGTYIFILFWLKLFTPLAYHRIYR